MLLYRGGHLSTLFDTHEFRCALPKNFTGLTQRMERNLSNGACWCGRQKREHPARNKLNASSRKRCAATGKARKALRKKVIWRELVKEFHGRCAYCGFRRRLNPDHVHPLSRGGRDSIYNVLPACDQCNGKKKDLMLLEFIWRFMPRQSINQGNHFVITIPSAFKEREGDGIVHGAVATPAAKHVSADSDAAQITGRTGDPPTRGTETAA